MTAMIYRLRTKHRPQLLFAMMRALAGEDTRISFEGRLLSTDLIKIDGVRFVETEILRRGTLQPRLDFLVLPLTPALLSTIERAIESKISFSRYAGIVHVQIEKDGEIAFAAYDHFHEDCVIAYPAVPVALLKELVEKRVLHSFEVAN
jgi:hypothetical protein